MNTMASFFYNRSKLIVAIFTTIVTFSYLFIVFIDASKCFEVENSNVKTLGTSFGMSIELVKGFFSARSTEMLTCYIEFNTIWDNIFAFLNGLMYVTWLSFLFRPYSLSVKSLNLFPFVYTIFDFLENYKLKSMAQDFIANTQISASDVRIASFFSMVKWISTGLIFALLFIGLYLMMKRAIKNNKQQGIA